MSKEIKDKIVPELRFPEFQDAEEWKETKLGQCLSKHPEYGINAPAVPYSDNLPKYLRITDISVDGHFLRNQMVSVEKNVTDNNYLDEDDIVLARTGASVGKSYRYRIEDGKLVFAGFLIRVKPNKKKLNPELLFQFLATEQYWRWVNFISARSGQPGINGNEYSSMPLPLPSSLQEQQKIASCLSSIDDLIHAQNQKLETLRTHKKGLMQQLFPAEGETVPKLRFEEFWDDGEWEEKVLSEIAELTSSKRVHLADYVPYGIPFFRGKEISLFKKGEIPDDILYISEEHYEDIRNKYDVPKIGDILITAVGTLGNIYCVRNDEKFYFKDGNLIWLKNISIDSLFLEILLDVNKDKVLASAIGSSQKALTMAALNKLEFKIPKTPEQQKIADCLSSLDELIAAQSQKLEMLKVHKKGLMQGLFPNVNKVSPSNSMSLIRI